MSTKSSADKQTREVELSCASYYYRLQSRGEEIDMMIASAEVQDVSATQPPLTPRLLTHPWYTAGEESSYVAGRAPAMFNFLRRMTSIYACTAL